MSTLRMCLRPRAGSNVSHAASPPLPPCQLRWSAGCLHASCAGSSSTWPDGPATADDFCVPSQKVSGSRQRAGTPTACLWAAWGLTAAGSVLLLPVQLACWVLPLICIKPHSGCKLCTRGMAGSPTHRLRPALCSTWPLSWQLLPPAPALNPRRRRQTAGAVALVRFPLPSGRRLRQLHGTTAPLQPRLPLQQHCLCST
jgi:hypothetical protein